MPADITRNLNNSFGDQSHTLTAVGHAEDLSHIITNIEPKKTFFLSEFEQGPDAVELDFSWMTEGLRPPQDDAHLEKENYVSEPRGSLEGLENHCQHFITGGWVTDAQIKVKKVYQPQDEFSRQYTKAFTEHATNIEYMIVNGTASNAESGTTPARSGGIPFFMQSQSIAVTVNATDNKITAASAHKLLTGDFVYFVADTLPTGLKANTIYYIRQDATTPATVFQVYDTQKAAVEGTAGAAVVVGTAGTNVKIIKNNILDKAGTEDFDLDDVNDVMQMCYNRGGDPTLAVMAPSKKRRFSQLITSVTQINRDMTRKGGKVTRALDIVADVYETDFGIVTAKSHRMYPENRIDLLDMNYWKMRWFDRTHEVAGIAKKGTFKEFFIESWIGLEGTQPKASGSIINIKR